MKAIKVILLLLVLLWPVQALAAGFHVVAATPVWVDFWGKLTVKGEPCQAGDQVAVFDPQGVCCGVATVTAPSAAAGLYPFLHVYGDDSTTPGIDEGAVTGDVLTFRVYRASEDKQYSAAVQVSPQDAGAPNPPQWINPPLGKSAWQVDVSVAELFWELPNQNVPFGQPFPPLDLDSYLAEPSDAGQVTWTAEPQGTHLTATVTSGHVLNVTYPAGWTGAEAVRVTGTRGPDSISQDVVFTVGANRAPELGTMPGPQTTDEGKTLSLDLTATDPDGNQVTFSLEPQVNNASLVPLPPSNGTYKARLVFAPDYDQAGSYSFVVKASDGYLEDEGGLSVTVNDVGDVDVVAAWDLLEGQPYDLTVSGTGTLLDGFRIIIPTGAIPHDIHLTISLIDDSLLPALPEGAFGFRFRLGPEGLVFNQSVTIIAPYGSTDPTGKNILVYRYGEGVSGWSTQYVTDVAIDRDANTVTFKTTRFSAFTPAATDKPIKPESSKNGGGGCFIATAAFGSPLEAHVAVLRAFRDKWLLACAPGRLFVSGYYRFSPAAAEYIRQHRALMAPVRAALYPLVGLGHLAQSPQTLPLGLLTVVAAGGGALALRRRRHS